MQASLRRLVERNGSSVCVVCVFRADLHFFPAYKWVATNVQVVRHRFCNTSRIESHRVPSNRICFLHLVAFPSSASVIQAGANDASPVEATLVPGSEPAPQEAAAAVALPPSPVKEKDVEKLEKQIVKAGPSAEKPADAKSKSKPEPKPQVCLWLWL